MSIDTAAKDLADELSHQDYVEVLCHHDADGIAAGTIMATALFRAHIPFRLRVTHRLSEQNLPSSKPLLLCDLGSGLSDLPEETMVIDHHIPFFEGPYHVNPRLDRIDGDTDLSAAGAAYLVANALGDNRDLAGLVLVGVIGDGQTITGKNQDIYLDALVNGIITKKRGLILPGRSPGEQVLLATEPFLAGVSGDLNSSEELVSQARDETGLSYDILCSLLVFHASGLCRPTALQNFWGDVWVLEREIMEKAHDLAFVVDACGKSGAGGTAVSLCLRSSPIADNAFEIAKNHRMALINEMNQYLTLPHSDEIAPVFCSDQTLASDLADTIIRNISSNLPVIVTVRNSDGTCTCSVRTEPGKGKNIGEMVYTQAHECGGTGGGHFNRAGAVISCEHLNKFISGISEECSL